jgi:glycosyltransferase involved in cell wall biosynthesis
MNAVVFTSITANYIPKARLLARTLKRHHPELRFCLVLAEPAEPDLTSYEPAFDEVLTLDDMLRSDREPWIFQHSVVEICTAIKGYALNRLLAREGVEAVIYLDPDIVVFSRLEPVLEMLAQCDVVLTPHLCDPEAELQAILDNEVCALQHGIYNLGFLAVANRPEGRRFAAWWWDRLERFCYADIQRGLFTDQRWVDLAPAFFPTCGVVRHPGCNVATWNLGRRRLDGNFKQGFQVNGGPLIFYHFSGFDSGAHLAMLQRYAVDMPAAFLLRCWYLKETAQLDGRGYHRRRWRYDYFNNGAPILPDQRRRYREREDLRRRFPHPFATAGDSYRAWCQAEDGPTPTPPVHAGRTPLERYLADPALYRCPPHPWFNGDYYLRTQLDVVEAGLNPLLHYVRWGHAENRQPHPHFDPDYVRANRRGDRIRADDPLLDFVLRECRARPNTLYDPKLDAEVVNRWRATLSPEQSLVLFISHSNEGGVGIHIHKRINGFSERIRALVLDNTLSGRLRLSLSGHPELPALYWDADESLDGLLELLDTLGVARLEVHHVLGHERWVFDFIAKLGRPYHVILHDYYLLAPNPHLMSADGRFVGDDHLDDDECLRVATALWGVCDISLAAWRAKARWLLAGARRVLAPSHDLAARYRRVYPELSFQVEPHFEDPRPETVPVRLLPCASGEPLRVVLLGYLQPHKGGPVLKRCAQLARIRGAPLEFYLLGQIAGDELDDTVWMSGAYQPDELPRLLREINPHLAWFPAQCPESYSYTLSEAMQAGLPILASALGAFPERLAGRPWSWLYPWDAMPEVWLDRLLEIREFHFVQDKPARAEGEPTAKDSASYCGYHLDRA